MIGVGGTLALSGAVLWIVGNVQEGATASVRRNAVELPEAQRSAERLQLGGMALTLVGACALGVSAVMWSWAPDPRPGAVSAAFMVAPGGGGVSLAGRFP